MTPQKFLEKMKLAGHVPAPGVTSLGLDSSFTGYGISIIYPDGRVMVGETGWSPSPTRLKEIYQFLGGLILAVRPNFASIEGYAYGKLNAREMMGEIGGISRLVCQLTDTKLYIYAPNQLKKFVTGGGTAPKDQMTKELFKHFSLDTSTNNECDAATAALMGLTAEGKLEVSKARSAALVPKPKKTRKKEI